MARKDIVVAILGQRDSGKTTFVVEYQASSKTGIFQRETGYRLEDEEDDPERPYDPQDPLVVGHQNILDGVEVEKTTARTTYRLLFCVKGIKKPPFRLVCEDYPGEWWGRVMPDAQEKAKSDELRTALINADVGFLLLDGQLYRDKKERYVAEVLGQFQSAIMTRIAYLQRHGQEFVPPSVWFICLTKVDLLVDTGITAAGVHDLIRRSVACNDVQVLRDYLPGFGDNYLLLSSGIAVVEEEGKRGVRQVDTIGFELIMPLVLDRYVATVKTEIDIESEREPSPLQRIFSILRGVRKSIDGIKMEAEEARRDSELLEKTALQMRATLEDPKFQSVYHCTSWRDVV